VRSLNRGIGIEVHKTVAETLEYLQRKVGSSTMSTSTWVLQKYIENPVGTAVVLSSLLHGGM
jgi:hypothetical protein